MAPLTDGTATISPGLTGGVAGTFSGNVTAVDPKDGTMEIVELALQVQTILLQVELSRLVH